MVAHRGKWVAYYRVSTKRQGASGLGLDAQRQAVQDYLNGGPWQLVGEYTEVESGKKDDRPQLAAALAACRVHKATLVIARLDRLSRRPAFLLALQDAGVAFVALDMPEADRDWVGMAAIWAGREHRMISERTKAALAAAKARGTRLGTPANLSHAHRVAGSAASVAARRQKAAERAADLAPTIAELQNGGTRTLQSLADGLNARGIPATRGGAWRTAQVWRLLRAIDTHKETADAH